MFLFDTDTICNVLRRNPSEHLLRRLRAVESGAQFICTITVAEIVYGAERSEKRAEHLRNLEEVLLPLVNVLDFDVRAAYVAGRIRAVMERRGRSVAFADSQIAATAVVWDLTLVTGNVKHFHGIPQLRVENWMAPEDVAFDGKGCRE